MSEINTSGSILQSTLCEDDHFASNVFNEMFNEPGQIRPHWEYLGQSLDALGQNELLRRNHEARRLIRDNDVTYNIYNDPRGIGRSWDLDLIPQLIESEEWSQIETGLIQRAELLNLILGDLYGPRQLIKQGIIPPELLYAHPAFLRPCDGISRDDGRYLHLYAADLARNPDGNFVVIADRTQAPAGAGYALENRIVLSRVLPSLFRDSHVHRLAPFFRTLKNTMNSLAPKPVNEPRIVLLSPGVGNESYFEHAYLANYLGYTLVQGGDLTVRNNHVWLKTLDKLQQVDVILRRVDDAYCDPLELREDSFLGVPGLLEVVRQGNVSIANSLGSGILQNPALMSYMPEISRFYFNEDLRLDTARTWWCGKEGDKQYVLDHLEQLVIKPLKPVNNSQRTILGSDLTKQQLADLKLQIQARPLMFTAQEQVALSAAPVLQQNSNIDTRHVVMRSYLVADDQSFSVMPGALTRVSANRDDYMVSNQLGGASKDTWVLASEPEKHDSLIAPLSPIGQRLPDGGHVPSRVADNLFWLGRYAERAEGLVRLLRVVQLYLADQPYIGVSDQDFGYVHNQLLRAVTQNTGLYPGFVGKNAEQRLATPEDELLSVITDRGRTGSLTHTLYSMLVVARSVRDRLSTDTLRVINDIDNLVSNLRQDNLHDLNDVDDELDNLIVAFVSFSGLTIENMTHGQGWHFLQIGRRVERAIHTTSLIRSTLVMMRSASEEEMMLESVLSVLDCLMTYKRNFSQGYEVSSFLDLMLLNESNPRSVAYQLARLQEHVGILPNKGTQNQLSNEQRLMLELITKLRLSQTSDLVTVNEESVLRGNMDGMLEHVQKQMYQLTNMMTQAYFQKDEFIQQLVPIRTGN